ncbi:hypothetical protein M9458_054679, partial [Cirrhinus mrigala]
PKPVEPEIDLKGSDPQHGEDLIPSFECEWDLVDLVELSTPGPSVPKPDPEEDLNDSVELCIPDPSASELRPEWDLAALEELLENYIPLNVFQLEDRLKRCELHKQRHVSNIWPKVFIGD